MAISLCVVLVAAMMFLGDALRQPGIWPALAYLPGDGESWGETQSIDDDGQESSRALVTESARLRGTDGAVAIDGPLQEQVIGAVGGFAEARSTEFWRTTSTALDDEGRVDAGEPQQVRLFTVDADIALLAELDPTLQVLYTPAVTLVPDDAEPGSSWEQRGRTDSGARYTSSLSLASAGTSNDDCLVTSGTIEIPLDDYRTRIRSVRYTWCPGQGIVESTEETQGVVRTTAREDHDVVPVAVPPHIKTWSDPGSWRQSGSGLFSTYAGEAGNRLAGSRSSIPALSTSRRTLVQVLGNHDVAAFEATDGSYHTRWRARPGGQILTISAPELSEAGALILLGTNRRNVMAYDDRGGRLWEVTLGEVVMNQIVAVDDSTVLALTAAGDVHALDARTGTERWRVSLGDAVEADPVVAGEAVLVASRNGDVRALDATTGEQLWRTTLPSARALGTTTEVALVAGYRNLTALDLRTGQPLWGRAVQRVSTVVSGEDVAVISASDGVIAVDSSGVVQWERSSAGHLQRHDEYLIVLETDALVILDSAGVVHREDPLLPVGVADEPMVTVLPDGVAIAQEFDLIRWT